MLHVVSNLSKLPGLRKRVVRLLEDYGVPRARSEIRTCGWLAQVDEHGGSIWHWRPTSKGAQDMAGLIDEALERLGFAVSEPVLPPIDTDATAAVADPDDSPIGRLAALPQEPIPDTPLLINHHQSHDQAA